MSQVAQQPADPHRRAGFEVAVIPVVANAVEEALREIEKDAPYYRNSKGGVTASGGERVVDAMPDIGYLHSGFEKLGEHLDYNQYVTVTDRMNYVSPVANNVAWHHAVETLMGIEVPPRCQYIRVIVTRGCGTLGLDPNRCSNPQVIIITDHISLYPDELYQQGLEIITVSTVRNHPAALSPRIKSLNYLNNILAKIEGMQAGCIEALMLNHKGEVAECTGDNIFLVRDGQLCMT